MAGLFDTPKGRVRFIAHRGFTPLAPENSLPAFAYAGRLGFWAIETDVRFTRDGVAMCCHNASVDAMYDGAGDIGDMTYADIARLRLKTGNRLACFAADALRMPLFSEYLCICRRYRAAPFIELKTDDAGRVAHAVEQAGFDQREVIYSAVGLPRVLAARRAAPGAFIHLIFGAAGDLPVLAEAGNAGLSYKIADPFDCPQSLIDDAHALGLRVCLRAGDTARDVARMMALGVDYVPTNQMATELGALAAPPPMLLTLIV